MVKHNHGNAPLTGTYTDNECGFVADQNSKKKNLQSKTEADKRGYTLESSPADFGNRSFSQRAK